MKFIPRNITTIPMEKNNLSMIHGVVNSLNWNVIIAHYQIDNKVLTQFSERKRADKYTIKKDLMELVNFMVDTSCRHLEQEEWIIDLGFGEQGINKLEIAFCPTRSTMVDDDIHEDTIEDEDEINALVELLKKNEDDEKYERCAAINSRLKRLKKNRR